MTERQIKTLLQRISSNDSKRNEFLKLVIPSLQKTEKISNTDPRPRYICCYCKASNKQTTFTDYFAYVRHLDTLHKNHLPCNGNIFERKSNHFECIPCNKRFNRKDHYSQHLKNLIHKENLKLYNEKNAFNQTENQYLESDSFQNLYNNNNQEINDDVNLEEKEKEFLEENIVVLPFGANYYTEDDLILIDWCINNFDYLKNLEFENSKRKLESEDDVYCLKKKNIR